MFPPIVMAGLVPAIHVFIRGAPVDAPVDARVKPGHDGVVWGRGK